MGKHGWQKDQSSDNNKYKTNDYLYASDINKMISLFNSFIVFDDEGKFKGIKIEKDGLSLYTEEGNKYKLTIDENGILQTEQI